MAQGFLAPRSDAGSDDPRIIRQHAREISTAVRVVMQGGLNVCGDFTIAAGVGTTTLSDGRLTGGSVVLLTPITANAAAALANVYASTRNNGSWVFTHANNAQVDRTFRYAVIG